MTLGGMAEAAATKRAPQRIDRPPDGSPEDRDVLLFNFKKCNDKAARSLIGLPREKAIARILKMRLPTYRFVSWDETVNFEVVPYRLTAVVNWDGQVQRAFCR